MKREEIHLNDIGRLFFGQAPPLFLLEVFVRSLVIYLHVPVTVRWLGKRLSGQLTMVVAVMLILGAIVSVSMPAPDRGIVQGLILLLCGVSSQRGISYLGAVFVYLLLMVAMRLLDKCMSSTLGRNEMFAMVTLAAPIGIPLQTPEHGLSPALLIGIIVVFFGRWIALKAFTDQHSKKMSQGNVAVLANDSVMDLAAMKAARLTRERLAAQLRSSGVKQLGVVKRLYMEANGSFSMIESKDPQPGLFVIPR